MSTILFYLQYLNITRVRAIRIKLTSFNRGDIYYKSTSDHGGQVSIKTVIISFYAGNFGMMAIHSYTIITIQY